jgi:N-methylhydantoinase B
MGRKERTAFARSSTATPDGILRYDEFTSKLAVESWDGKVLPYAPSATRLAGVVANLHGEFEAEIDPIEYQVLRWRLWNINLEHDETIRRVCGTSVICYSLDYNTSLMTEGGDTVLGGPGLQRFVGQGDMAVKFLLEHFQENPRIEPGDVFILNDPYIAGSHQLDVNACMPVFVDAKLYAWVFNAAHQMEIGGSEPGSFCFRARDIFDEPLPWPPIKLVRGGELQHDLLNAFMRQSRTPAAVALNLRSQLAGLEAASARLKNVIEGHGAKIVKGAMRRMIRDTSRAVSERLLAVPDGEWHEMCYSGAAPDRRLRRICLTVRKHGDVLTFSNAGTAAQISVGNGTYCSFRGGAIACVQTMLAWDQMYCPAGVLNHLRFDPTPSTVTVASFPAALTVLYGTQLNIHMAGQVVSKMLLCGPEALRERAIASGGGGYGGFCLPWAVDQHEDLRFGAGSEALIGALGASSGRDGVDTGGGWEAPRLQAANVEEAESVMPVLHLFRREQENSGGPGRWRGGNGVAAAYIGHKARQFYFVAMGSDPGVNSSLGLSGGLPGHSGTWLARTETVIHDRLAAGEIPASKAELEAALGVFDAVSTYDITPLELGSSGVAVAEFAAGAGFGDPLLRDPLRVAEDVITGSISREAASRDYGVVVAPDGAVDAAATGLLRTSLRSTRLSSARPSLKVRPPRPNTPDGAYRHPVAEGLELALVGEDALWCCSECRTALIEATANFRDGCSVRERLSHEVDPERYPKPTVVSDDDGVLVIREFLCPSCGQLLATDFCLSTDEYLWDLKINLSTVASSR